MGLPTPWDIIHSVPCGTPCRFVHPVKLPWSLRPQVLVWSEGGRSWHFPQIWDFRFQWVTGPQALVLSGPNIMNQACKVTETYHSKIKVQFCHVRAHDIRVAFDKFLFRRVQPPFDIFRKDGTKLPSEALQSMCTVVPGPQKPLWQYQTLLDWIIASTNLDTNHHVHQIKTFLNRTNVKQSHSTTLASQLTALFR